MCVGFVADGGNLPARRVFGGWAAPIPAAHLDHFVVDEGAARRVHAVGAWLKHILAFVKKLFVIHLHVEKVLRVAVRIRLVLQVVLLTALAQWHALI